MRKLVKTELPAALRQQQSSTNSSTATYSIIIRTATGSDIEEVIEELVKNQKQQGS